MPLREILIDRRDFIKGGATAGLTAAYPTLFRPGGDNSKPNILLIMSDEHNQTVTGCYGNKVVKTPNIDALAASGITFENHYCNSPLCVPSRSSFTAGKYASRVDVWGLTNELPSDDMPSIARSVTAAGYDSYLCGKMHYKETRRYGFTQVGGDFNNYPKTGRGRRMKPSEIQQHTPLSPRFTEFHPGDMGSTVKHDRRVTAGALDFLGKRDSEKPFFLLVGYLTPHFPLIVPEPFADEYRDKVPMPDIPEGLIEHLPTNYKLQRTGFHETDVPQATVKSGRELYYGLTSWMDNEVGKVVAALRANPKIADNTVIIYTTDHGENMGEKGLWWKNNMYDQASRVPLVISYPKHWKGGQRRSQSSSHVDLVKTVVDIAGGQTPGDWNGESMLPWMANANYKWRDVACVEYYAQFIAHGLVMYRTGKWKYVYHGKPAADMPVELELFDMQADPKELHNLAADPRHKSLIKDLHARMVKEVGGDPDVTELRSRQQLAAGYPGAENEEGGGEGL